MEFLFNIIKHMFPNIKDEDFTLKDDGEGVYILEWKSSETQPTIEELDSYFQSHKDEILELLKPTPSQVDVLEQTQADLIMTLMMNGVI